MEPTQPAPNLWNVPPSFFRRHRLLIGWLIVTVLAGALSWTVKRHDDRSWMFGVFSGLLIVVLFCRLLNNPREHLERGSFRVVALLAITWLVWLGVGLAVNAMTPTSIYYTHDLDTPGRLLYAGKLIGTANRGETITERFLTVDEKQVGLEVLTPDGWGARPFELSFDFAKQEPKTPRTVKPRAIDTVTLWIDNRGSKATTLICGEVSLPLAGDSPFAVRIPSPTMPAQTPLRLSDQEIGALKERYYLIDTTGRRSYRMRENLYGIALFEKPEPSPDVLLTGKLLHPLKHPVDYFLTPAPETLTVQKIQGLGLTKTVKLWELLELP